MFFRTVILELVKVAENQPANRTLPQLSRSLPVDVVDLLQVLRQSSAGQHHAADFARVH